MTRIHSDSSSTGTVKKRTWSEIIILGQSRHYPGALLLKQTDVEAFHDLWHCHPPTLVSRFVDETKFCPEIVGWRKSSPKPKPSVAPSFERLKGPPPDGNASEKVWKEWHRRNSCGGMDFWEGKYNAMQYRCPDKIDIELRGISHEFTVTANADVPLSAALASYCASTSESDFAVTPSEVILRTYGDDPTFLDA